LLFVQANGAGANHRGARSEAHVPLMLSSDAGSAARSQIGIVVIFDISFATLLTLIVILFIDALLTRF
jgi:multidrug efflux pump subunit AcrB